MRVVTALERVVGFPRAEYRPLNLNGRPKTMAKLHKYVGLKTEVPENYLPLADLKSKAVEMGISWSRLDRALGGDYAANPEPGWDGLVYVQVGKVAVKRYVPKEYFKKLPALKKKYEAEKLARVKAQAQANGTENDNASGKGKKGKKAAAKA